MAGDSSEDAAELSEDTRRDLEIEQLKRDKESLAHELELKAQLYQSELRLMREMLSGYKEEREVTFQRITSLEQQREPLQKEAERAVDLENELLAATAEVTELNEALKELEEEVNLKKEEELAELRQRFDKERQGLQEQVQKLVADNVRLDELQDDNEAMRQQFRGQEDHISELTQRDEYKEALLQMLLDGKHIDKAGLVKLRKAGRDVALGGRRSPRAFDTSLKISTPRPSLRVSTETTAASNQGKQGSSPNPLMFSSLDSHLSKLSGLRHQLDHGASSSESSVSPEKRACGASGHMDQGRETQADACNANENIRLKLSPEIRLTERIARFGMSGIPIPATPRSSRLRGVGPIDVGEGGDGGWSGGGERGRPMTPRTAQRSPTRSTAGSTASGSTRGVFFGSVGAGSARKREPSPSPIRSLRTAA